MKTLLYVRGEPGTGKHTVGQMVANYLGWPMLWVHLFDPVYRLVGDHRVPALTDELMTATATHLMSSGRDFLVVRPSRWWGSVSDVRTEAEGRGYRFVLVRLAAEYPTMLSRVLSRSDRSEFRISTKEALDEYLAARPAVELDETVIDTTRTGPELVARRVVSLVEASDAE